MSQLNLWVAILKTDSEELEVWSWEVRLAGFKEISRNILLCGRTVTMWTKEDPTSSMINHSFMVDCPNLCLLMAWPRCCGSATTLVCDMCSSSKIEANSDWLIKSTGNWWEEWFPLHKELKISDMKQCSAKATWCRNQYWMQKNQVSLRRWEVPSIKKITCKPAALICLVLLKELRTMASMRLIWTCRAPDGPNHQRADCRRMRADSSENRRRLNILEIK